MNEKETAKIALYDKLKTDFQFLRLNYKTLRKRFARLLRSYDIMASHHFDGVAVYDANDPALESIPHISTRAYTNAIGLYDKSVMNLLVDKGVIVRAHSTVYLANPEKHGHLAFYKRFNTIKGHYRHCLYWNIEGVKFLDGFIRENGLIPKKEFTL